MITATGNYCLIFSSNDGCWLLGDRFLFFMCNDVLIFHLSHAVYKWVHWKLLLVLKSSVCSCIICKINTRCLFVSWENNLQWKRCIRKVTVQTQANVLLLFEWCWILQRIKVKLLPKCSFFCECIWVKPLCKSIIMTKEALRITVFTF